MNQSHRPNQPRIKAIDRTSRANNPEQQRQRPARPLGSRLRRGRSHPPAL